MGKGVLNLFQQCFKRTHPIRAETAGEQGPDTVHLFRRGLNGLMPERGQASPHPATVIPGILDKSSLLQVRQDPRDRWRKQAGAGCDRRVVERSFVLERPQNTVLLLSEAMSPK